MFFVFIILKMASNSSRETINICEKNLAINSVAILTVLKLCLILYLIPYKALSSITFNITVFIMLDMLLLLVVYTICINISQSETS